MIGIYGGTFDPVHYGHLRTALEVREAVGLDEIRFMPCRHPPHRSAPTATPAQRLKMLELALAGAEPGFRIDLREFHRDGPSYMVDTLASLRSEVGDTPLCLILGLDAFGGYRPGISGSVCSIWRMSSSCSDPRWRPTGRSHWLWRSGTG